MSAPHSPEITHLSWVEALLNLKCGVSYRIQGSDFFKLGTFVLVFLVEEDDEGEAQRGCARVSSSLEGHFLPL